MFSFVIVVLGGIFFSALTIVSSDVADDNIAANTTSLASVYMWQQNVPGDWQSPASWSPARTVPASSDVLVFDLGGTTTATNVPTQTIGQLIVSGNTAVSLQSATAIVLTIEGGIGDDLVVASNSALNFNAANPITASLPVGATGNINGSLTFSSSGQAAHRLTAIDANAVRFNSGAVFTAGEGFTGNPFGAGSLNSVIFSSPWHWSR